ncbi:YsaB family lipoprotein [unidentified bacterial endosymbiont]|jgi:YsaB-like lipoprotein|uniref:YsaB family lipoprotein n=1 Tax=unidentified bacterial endosymbiont TaxID=2355 RepID=UPI00209DBF8C|nr:YsaB family lipoprotein [unidentified bacterial endosymbiont]
MMTKRVAPLFLLLTLAGCSASQDAPAQKAQQGRVSPERSLNMEQICKDRAAHRYNSAVQKIDVTGFERFQGSYELQGYTSRKEGFVCSFDADGQFLHLSMR